MVRVPLWRVLHVIKTVTQIVRPFDTLLKTAASKALQEAQKPANPHSPFLTVALPYTTRYDSLPLPFGINHLFDIFHGECQRSPPEQVCEY